jgi:putative FmdB family regulatory protein
MLKMYDFKCNDCSKEFEKLTKGTEAVECPFCGSTQTERMLSANSIKVNGQGAYTNRMKV